MAVAAFDVVSVVAIQSQTSAHLFDHTTLHQYVVALIHVATAIVECTVADEQCWSVVVGLTGGGGDGSAVR